MKTARLFKTGGSKAVRLPKSWIGDTTEVEMERRGKEYHLAPETIGLVASCGRMRLAWRPFYRAPPSNQIRNAGAILMALVLLDTSCCIDILRGNPLPEKWRAHRFCLSSIVETELWAGVYHSGGKNERVKVEKLLASVERVAFDSKAAEAAGKILGTLTKAGKSIGDFDCQIAGHAIALNALLATRNRRHFQRIKGLELLDT